jgi:outer membrane protein TolC/ABC-type uncharacterized transport system substrate-binding protein
MLLLLVVPGAVQARNRQPVSIGVVVDGQSKELEVFFDNLRLELRRLLGARYNIRIGPRRILSADWGAERARRHYRRLAGDAGIDLIIGAGVITTTVLAAEKSYPKPVLTIGMVDPGLQGVAPAVNNRSGIANFTYIQFNRSFENDLRQFHAIVPFNKVAVIAHGELLKLVMHRTGNRVRIKKGQTVELIPVHVLADSEAALRQLGEADAAYFGYLGSLSDRERDSLIRKLTDRGIPTYGFTVKDVRRGALAAAAPEENWDKLVRRMALNIEAILAGSRAADLPVQIDFDEELTINMATARRLGISPKFSVLSQAVLLNEFAEPEARSVTLASVMQEASQNSLDVKIEARSLDSAREDISRARADWLPSLSASGDYAVIDRESAQNSFGTQAERTSSGSLAARQILYSDDIAGQITSRKHLLRAAQSTLEQTRLDAVLSAVLAYSDILKAKTGIKIRQDNVDMTRRHLGIAKKREAIGHSGRADVFRWESNLAGARTDLIVAKNAHRLAKQELNRILNRPLEEAFAVHEMTLADNIAENRILGRARTHVTTYAALDVFMQFLSQEAVAHAPEVARLQASMASQQRQLLSLKRKRFIPVFSVNAQGKHVFSRQGEGVDFPGIDPPDDSWSTTLDMTWPLFQGGGIASNIRKTEIEIQKLQDQKLKLIRTIGIRVRSALFDVVNNDVNLENAKRSADFAAKSLALVRDGYETGKSSLTELVDAQNAALTAELAALNSEYDFLVSLLTLERSIGHFVFLNSMEENQAYLDRMDDFFARHQDEPPRD